MISADEQAKGYSEKAAAILEKAKVVGDTALRKQLLDLAQHYNCLAAGSRPSINSERAA